MENKQRVVFLGSFSGVGKQSGKKYQQVKLATIVSDTEGIKSYIRDYFVDVEMNLQGFQFGDIVNVSLGVPMYIGGMPPIEAITLVEASPYDKGV